MNSSVGGVSEAVLLERQGAIAFVTINLPEKLNALDESLARMDTPDTVAWMTYGHRLFMRVCEFPKPVIAMVNGYALGGGFELGLSCDMVVASEDAVFRLPEIALDTLPGWGGTELAPRKMGPNGPERWC